MEAYTNLEIEEGWDHVMSQFQVQGVMDIYSSFFMEKIERIFLLIYKKKNKKKNSLLPGMYRDPLNHQVKEEVKLLVVQGLIFSQIQSYSFPGWIPNSLVQPVSRNPMI